MEQTIIFPSPNWFQTSGLAVSTDGWLIYGGPSKSLCVLEPLPLEVGIVQQKINYKAHVKSWAHPEKIVSVDISPDWHERKSVLIGSIDGLVKQWTIDKNEGMLKIKSTHNHEIHSKDREEVVGVGYCNGSNAITVGCHNNIVKWDLTSNVVKTYNNLLQRFKPTCMKCSQHVQFNVAVGTKQGVVFVLDLSAQGKVLYKVRGQDEEILNVSWCPQYALEVKRSLTESEKKSNLAQRLEKIRSEGVVDKDLDESATGKELPDDSFDETIVIVPEDEMFDVYKDHADNEFGHKKFQDDILVNVKLEDEENLIKETSFLDECEKLKEEILKKKNQPDTVESLVEKMSETHVYDKDNPSDENKDEEQSPSCVDALESSNHIHKHLLATVSKLGSVRIWSKTGKLVASCLVPAASKHQRHKMPNCATVLWHKSETLLVADGAGHLLEINPLQIDRKNKLQWRLLHSEHKRSLFCIASDTSKVQTDSQSDGHIWTVSQDRNLICYSLKDKKIISVFNTSGGYLYNIQPCPYDPRRIAISAGDGMVRVWQADTLPDDDSKLTGGQVTSYWQNVLGKVLTVAWHPTKENLLAFGTAEARVGVIEAGRGGARALGGAGGVRGAVYSLAWGAGDVLYACGARDLVAYHSDNSDKPTCIPVVVEGAQWQVVACRVRGAELAVGSAGGGVAVIAAEPPHELRAAAFVFTKMIHTIEWHPEQTSEANEESVYRNLMAVCSLDKQNSVIVLEYGDNEDGSKRLVRRVTLAGHGGAVLQLAWNPHREMELLTTSRDSTVRVWDVLEGNCKYIFNGHEGCTLSAAWSAFPLGARGGGGASGAVVSGGADCCLRLWRPQHFPADAYQEIKSDGPSKKDKKKKLKKEEKKGQTETKTEGHTAVDSEEDTATNFDVKLKSSHNFLLPIIHKQIGSGKINGAKAMYRKHLEKNSIGETKQMEEELYDIDYIKIFGSISEVNEVLDKESERHSRLQRVDAWLALAMLRGRVEEMVQFAAQRDLLSPLLLSLAPTVSHKYWKDCMQLYIAQIDRLVAKGEESKLYESRAAGGAAWLRTRAQLAALAVPAAVQSLLDYGLYKEAYVLCRIRYATSLASDVLNQWAKACYIEGKWAMAAVCNIALGDISRAAEALSKSNDQDYLSLAAAMAKTAGQVTFAGHLENRKELLENAKDEEEILEQLPSRACLLMEKDKVENGEATNQVLNSSKTEFAD